VIGTASGTQVPPAADVAAIRSDSGGRWHLRA
jgi:hypothetical protein